MAENIADLAIRVSTQGTKEAVAELNKLEDAADGAASAIDGESGGGKKRRGGGKGVAKAAKEAKSGLEGSSESVRSLIFSFNGLAASSLGVSQSFGTLFSNIAPMLLGGTVTAGLLIATTLLGRAFRSMGGEVDEAKNRIDEAVTALEKLRQEVLSDPVKIEINIQEATKKLNELNARIRQTRLIAAGASSGEEGSLLAGALAEGKLPGLVNEAGNQGAGLFLAKQRDAFLKDKERADALSGARTVLPGDPILARRGQEMAAGFRAQALALGIYNPLAKEYIGLAEQVFQVDDKREKQAARKKAAAGPKAPTAFGAVTYDSPFQDQIDSIFQGALKGQFGGSESSYFDQRSSVASLGIGKGLGKTIQDQIDSAAKFANFVNLKDTLAAGIFGAVSDGISAGFERGFATGSISEGFKGLAGALLGGLGGAIETFGKGVLAAAPLMVAIQGALRTFNPAASIPAGIALIALGASIKGLAGRAFASGNANSGGANFGASYGSGAVSSTTIDRGVIAGAYGNASVSTPSGGFSTPRFVNVNVGLLNPADPSSQRVIVDTIRNAGDRGLVAA